MPHRVQLKALNLALASALAFAVTTTACAQQNQNNGGPALPGPSLDDAPPLPPAVAPPTTPTPVSATPAAAPAPSSAAPAPTTSAAPAPTTSAAPAPTTGAASAPAPAQPAAPTTAPRRAAVVEQPAVADDAPWYEKAWGSVTGWFSGVGSKLSSHAEPKAAPAAPVAAKPASATDAAPRAREGFAADSPERTIRTGMGQCLKTGTWTPANGGAECPSGAAGDGKSADAVAAAPAKPAAPKAEPVEVKPLDQSAEKVAKPLEPEAPKAPEPAPAPAPAPAKPEVMTLSADALFAIGKSDLKPNARQGLDELANRLGQVDFESIKIVGHTDPTGASAANDRLSVRRAEAVKRYLVGKGVPANKIKTEGQGSRKPVVAQKECAKLAKAKKAACYQPDRRVEIEVNGATKRAAAK